MKGKGVKAVENKQGWHGKPLDDPEEAIAELGGERDLHGRRRQARARRRAAPLRDRGALELPTLGARRGGRDPARPTATRSPRSASRDGDVVALDGEVSQLDLRRDLRARPIPDRYFEMFIAEQQMVAAAVGLQVRGWVPFASTFAAFFTRAYDFIRMAAISRANIRLWRLARRRLDRRGRPVADGARGPRDRCAPSTARPCSTRATPTRRRSWSRRWPTATGSSTCARRARQTPVVYGAGRGVPDRRQRGRALVATATTSTIVGAGITLHEALEGRRRARGRGHRRARDRPLLGQADRRGDAARGGRGDRRPDRHRRGPLARGRPRRRRARRRSPTATSRCRVVTARRARDARLRHAGRAARTPPASTPSNRRESLERSPDAAQARFRPHPHGSASRHARATPGGDLRLAAMAVVTATNLRKELSGELLFDGVSFKVERRDRLALSGPNGAGKTTLLRMLAGETELDGGELVLRQGHAHRAARPAPAARARPARCATTSLSGARDLVATEERAARARAGDGRRRPRRRPRCGGYVGGPGAPRARGRLRLARARGSALRGLGFATSATSTGRSRRSPAAS